MILTTVGFRGERSDLAFAVLFPFGLVGDVENMVRRGHVWGKLPSGHKYYLNVI